MRPPELDGPDLPDELAFLWGYFTELHETRSGGMGPGPISYSEIDAWQRLTGRELPIWQVKAIKRMDRAFMQVEAKKNER